MFFHIDIHSVMMKRWKLQEAQAEAILNMRLRALRKLEEVEIRREHDQLTLERKELGRLVRDDGLRWKKIAEEIAELRRRFGEKTALGRRRTKIGEAPAMVEVPVDALVEREPITVVCSAKGWLRAFKGHLEDLTEIRYKEGDGPRLALHAESTDKLVVFATNGRFYTIAADRLPGARGDGEPLKLLVEIGNDAELVQILVHRPGRKLVVAASDGRGFIVDEDAVLAQTRAGKQVLNVSGATLARASALAEGDTLAVIGENRKLLLFDRAELPEMARGRGVILQRYKNGGLADLKVFDRAEGLTWRTGAGVRTETDIAAWLGSRGQAGRLPPAGFPRSGRFG